MKHETKNFCASAISVTSILVLWEIVARFDVVIRDFVSMPSKIFSNGSQLIFSGFIFPHILASMEALITGFFLAVFFGITGGLLIGSSKIIYKFFHIYIVILNAVPVVALLPLMLIWFGIGIVSKIAIIFLMSLVPIIISTIGGARNVDKNLLMMAKSNEAGGLFMIREVVFFGALPFIFSGVQIGIGRAVSGLVIAEIFGYGKGLGYLISFYGSTFQPAQLLFVVMLLVFITISLTWLIKYIEGSAVHWKN